MRTYRYEYLAGWLVLAVAISLIVGSFNWAKYRRLTQRGVAIEGTVIAVHPHEHQLVDYEYVVRGRRMRGRHQTWPPNPEFSGVSVGQTLIVYVDPLRPEDSVLGNPRLMFHNETMFIVMAALIVPTFLLVWWFWQQRRRHRATA